MHKLMNILSVPRIYIFSFSFFIYMVYFLLHVIHVLPVACKDMYIYIMYIDMYGW